MTEIMKYEIYSGAGNDFVMLNNWNNEIPFEEQSKFTVKICNENFKNIDGVIFADKPLKAGSSIRMNYYNRDGSFGAMCGNGARCIAMYAYKNNIIPKKEFIIEAVDELYKAHIIDDINVKVDFPEPKEITLNIPIDVEFQGNQNAMNVNYVNVGSDHIVIFINDLKMGESMDEIDINNIGKIIRFHKKFQPRGGNVSFVQILSDNEIRVRTYERGVERETLACGTGIIASAIVSGLVKNIKAPVKVLSQGGEWLTVDFKIENSKIKDLSLEGSAKKIGEGEI
jgi:diaminopimelate epimerase